MIGVDIIAYNRRHNEESLLFERKQKSSIKLEKLYIFFGWSFNGRGVHFLIMELKCSDVDLPWKPLIRTGK